MPRTPELLGDLVGQQHAARGRADHDLHLVAGEPAGQVPAQGLDVVRELEHLELLQVHGAVVARRQQEVALQQGARILEDLQDLVVGEHEGLFRAAPGESCPARPARPSA
jgi:hypothetical protein